MVRQTPRCDGACARWVEAGAGATGGIARLLPRTTSSSRGAWLLAIVKGQEPAAVVVETDASLRCVIESGDLAPDFELPDQDGAPVRLSALRGRPVVLYFYPKADASGA